MIGHGQQEEHVQQLLILDHADEVADRFALVEVAKPRGLAHPEVMPNEELDAVAGFLAQSRDERLPCGRRMPPPCCDRGRYRACRSRASESPGEHLQVLDAREDIRELLVVFAKKLAEVFDRAQAVFTNGELVLGHRRV